MKFIKSLLLAGAVLLSGAAQAEKITVAAAADLKFAMDEIAVAFKLDDANLFCIGCFITILIPIVFQHHGLFVFMGAEKVHVLVFVAGSDEFL